ETPVEFRTRVFGDEVKRRLLAGALCLSRRGIKSDEPYIVRALRVRRRIQDELRDLFRSVDVLLTPAAASVAPSIDDCLRVRETARLDAYAPDCFTVPASLAALPALTLPASLLDGGGQHPLPLGVQLVAARDDEARLCAIAAALEARLAFYQQLPSEEER